MSSTVATLVTKRKRFTGRKVSLMISGWVIGLIFLAPYIEMLITSVKSKSEILAIPTTYAPQHWTWSNYITIWKQLPLAQYLRTSIVVSLSATVLVLLIAVPAAYYVGRNKFRGRTAFLFLVLVTQMFSPTSLIIGIFREVIRFHLVDTWLALILIYAAFNLAFSIWILSSFFASIPIEIEEAAWIDGASRIQALRRVILPVALPGLITAFIFTFISAWNEFVIALTIESSPVHQPITVGLESLIGQYQVQWQYLFAGSLIAIVPVVILFALIEKWLVSGLTAGSVK
jgi:multiple sugar transport system permease protein